jgi:hypothetical protein
VGEGVSAPTSTALVHPATAEILDLANAETEQLATAIAEADMLQGRLRDFTGAVSDELLARMDRGASWTVRAGGYEITAPSPDAGTSGFDADALEAGLSGLVADGTVSADAAAAALERTVTVTLRVPFGTPLGDVAGFLRTVESIAGVRVWPLRVETARRVLARGVNQLRKVPGCAAAVDAARERREPPARRVKVKPVGGAR